jgi:hypothetical protein
MQVVAFVVIRHDRRGTRVHFRHLLLGDPPPRYISGPAPRHPADDAGRPGAIGVPGE